ncbi:ABC transporter ATP-binding protein [Ruegeria lacuscaerulensis]|uniref:ABC transporter ATP-binding protein n=1 Tax=Ruegeria lacuscaerulensis TaxID=55218 RepID=UPI00147D4633|nr:ABC transporter ATP-binding protein [Ruegeria lacuscaerulensis]
MNAVANPPHLRVEGLTKTFGPVIANSDVSFQVERGEILCLLGENGAGKSTLSSCLYGFYQADKGRIFYEGKEVEFHSPRDAIACGIGMVHQHFVLVTPMSVIENIVLGTHEHGWALGVEEAERRVRDLCGRYDIDLDLDAKIWQLSVGEQQWVEIVKALYLGAELLILDEPTAVLTPQESDKLFRIIRRMTGDGLSIIMISHKLNEVMQSDHVAVLRRGKIVDTVRTADVTKEDLTSMMVGRPVMLQAEREDMEPGETILEVAGLRVRNDKDQHAVKGMSFKVHAHEILGIAGVSGNGQNELFEALMGVRDTDSGQIWLHGEDVTHQNPRQMVEHGIGYIPDDRFRAGLVGSFSVAENTILGLQKNPRFSDGPLLNFRRILNFANEAIKRFGIVTPGPHARTDTLSGGNAQKIILAREFWSASCCILANQPTRGLDVGVIEYVHQMLLEKRRDGFAIVLASEELEDILALSDRIAVVFKGEIMGVFRSDEVDIQKLGLLMAGQRDAAAQSDGKPYVKVV